MGLPGPSASRIASVKECAIQLHRTIAKDGIPLPTVKAVASAGEKRSAIFSTKNAASSKLCLLAVGVTLSATVGSRNAVIKMINAKLWAASAIKTHQERMGEQVLLRLVH